MIWALFASLIVAGVIASGSNSFRAVDAMASADFSAAGQARTVAEAGLVDALAWFRRQQTQPVTTFAPKRDLIANPVVNETDDASVGLIRDYEIAPSLWARYVVKKPIAAETFTDANANGRYDYGESFTDTNASGVRDAARETRDVSLDRGMPGMGTVWRIESRGTVYNRPNLAVALGVGPNTRIASVLLASEIRRLTIIPPGAAAISSKTGSTIVIGARGRISGTSLGAGIVYSMSSGTPTIATPTDVTGNPSKGTVPSYLDAVDNVFGVSLPELRAMADADWISASKFPARIGDYSLNIVPGPITFDTARSLRGTGVVVVVGDCTLTAGNNAFFNGVLYVQGNLVMRGPTYFRGAVIVTGTVDIAGSGGDYSESTYDPIIISQILTLLGQYRFSTSPYVPAAAMPDGAADEDGLVRLQKSGRTLPGGNLPVSLGSSLKPPP